MLVKEVLAPAVTTTVPWMSGTTRRIYAISAVNATGETLEQRWGVWTTH